MPLPADLRAGLKSKVADIANISDRFGGMLTAGIFLQEFVGQTPWAHLDIAGPAFNERVRPRVHARRRHGRRRAHAAGPHRGPRGR